MRVEQTGEVVVDGRRAGRVAEAGGTDDPGLQAGRRLPDAAGRVDAGHHAGDRAAGRQIQAP